MSSPIAKEVMQHVDIKEWLVFGNSKQDLIDALTLIGAKFKRQHCGFNNRSGQFLKRKKGHQKGDLKFGRK